VPSCLRASLSSAFTLVELVVVIGIVSILAVTVLPIIANMWRETRGADAANRVNGLIRSARMRALGGRDTGLFFFVESGTQRVVFIQAEPPDYQPLPNGNPNPDLGQNQAPNSGDEVKDQHAADRFRVLEGNVFQLPPPFRVAPLAVLDPPTNATQDERLWNDDELANQKYDNVNVIFNNAGPQNHRNFFTIIFSPEGNLTQREVVLIHDPAPPTSNPAAAFGSGVGKITLLPVDAGTEYQPAAGSQPLQIGASLAGMVFADNNGRIAALNFPSVDGLLVYDDASFGQFPDDDDTDPTNVVDKRDYLAKSGQPLYISWQTGAIVRGPTGP